MTPTSTAAPDALVEKVARAIARVQSTKTASMIPEGAVAKAGTEKTVDLSWHVYVPEARAALSAIPAGEGYVLSEEKP